MFDAEYIVDAPLVLVGCEPHREAVKALGYKHVAVVDMNRGGEQAITGTGVKSQWSFSSFVLALPSKLADLRDDLAVRLGDDKCRWIDWPFESSPEHLQNALATARPMWTDEIATLSDIPEPGPVHAYTVGWPALDQHGFRVTLPAFMPVIGPYGSGKSVFLRQLLVNLWRLHGWKFLLTSFEERVKPRFVRDLRRNLIGKPQEEWTDMDVAHADGEIDRCAVFLRRKRNTTLDMARLLDRIEFAVKVHGVKVVAIDPVNEIDHQVARGESKTDYMGRFIMALKQLADDYGLLMICAAHPPKDGVEKRLQRNGLLTLNDGADTAHWGNKADIGLCLWRNIDGPTMLHIDKVKDHETMGKPTLCELHLNRRFNNFTVGRMGYDILGDNA